MSAHFSARLTLLDAQIIDADNRPIGRVDDLDLSLPDPGGRPQVQNILTGAQALGERLGGSVGRGMAAAAARLRPRGHPEGPAPVDMSLVDSLEPMVKLGVPLRELPHLAALERWLAKHLVEPLPGAGDARE
ncbi:MAG: hypothetical protein LC777_08455 [Actinobacteria bacterium]|nr:hypothetical protein [Actinomycetota bacterium]